MLGSNEPISGPKILQFLARFPTILLLDREYLRIGTRYRQSEKGLAIYKHSPTSTLNLVNFGPQTVKNRKVGCRKSRQNCDRAYFEAANFWGGRLQISNPIFSARQHRPICYSAICYRPSVRLSVRRSHWWISQKRLKLASCNLHHR